MRKEFFDYLLTLMENPQIYVLFVGLGYPRYDEFKAKYPDRVINTEASEQTALDIAVGLSHQGKIPFVYTITPFFWRGAETIRTYIAHHQYQVLMCGAGRDTDYTVDNGFSHDGTDLSDLMNLLQIKTYLPETVEDIKLHINQMIEETKPSFLSLRR
jgi:transketolase